MEQLSLFDKEKNERILNKNKLSHLIDNDKWIINSIYAYTPASFTYSSSFQPTTASRNWVVSSTN